MVNYLKEGTDKSAWDRKRTVRGKNPTKTVEKISNINKEKFTKEK